MKFRVKEKFDKNYIPRFGRRYIAKYTYPPAFNYHGIYEIKLDRLDDGEPHCFSNQDDEYYFFTVTKVIEAKNRPIVVGQHGWYFRPEDIIK